jgi:hypothetical protein
MNLQRQVDSFSAFYVDRYAGCGSAIVLTFSVDLTGKFAHCSFHFVSQESFPRYNSDAN